LGNRWKHFGEQVETLWGTGGNTLGIREDNQTPDTGGRARYLKREGKVCDFQNKTGNDETRHETERKS